MFHFHNGSCLAFMFSSFLMTLFLLPTERRNKIRVKKGKFFDECVGRRVGSVSVVCRPMRWPTCLPTHRWDRILYLYLQFVFLKQRFFGCLFLNTHCIYSILSASTSNMSSCVTVATCSIPKFALRSHVASSSTSV